MTPPTNLDDLRHVLALQDLVKLYGFVVDDAEWDRLGEVFAEDATIDYTPMFDFIPVMHGLDEIIRVFREEIEHPISHFVTNVMVDLDGPPDTAAVRSKLITVSRGKQPMVGEYRDDAVHTDDGWRLRHREAHRPRKLTELLEREAGGG